MSQEQQLPSTSSKAQDRTATPPLFKVLMHNDDYTTMEFVVEVLRAVFHQDEAAAERIMLAIHFQGLGHCGTYPFAVAETKTQEVRSRARKAGFPLRCSIEKE